MCIFKSSRQISHIFTYFWQQKFGLYPFLQRKKNISKGSRTIWLQHRRTDNLAPTTKENIAKGTKDPRVEFSLPINVTCLSHITSSRNNLDQDYLQNLDQPSTSKFQPNISILTKLKLQNIDQTLLQNLDQDSTS